MTNKSNRTPKGFSKRIKLLREAFGLGQKKLGELVGKSVQNVSKWELGEFQPNESVKKSIADLLGLSTNWLISGHGFPFEQDSFAVLHPLSRHFSSLKSLLDTDASTEVMSIAVFQWRLPTEKIYFSLLLQLHNRSHSLVLIDCPVGYDKAFLSLIRKRQDVIYLGSGIYNNDVDFESDFDATADFVSAVMSQAAETSSAATYQSTEAVSPPLAACDQSALAKMIAFQCFRNSTSIEDIHAGIQPVSLTGDYSDVKVIDAEGNEILWPDLSRIFDDEMKRLNKEIVNNIFTILYLFENGSLRLRLPVLNRATVPLDWDPPAFTEDLLEGIIGYSALAGDNISEDMLTSLRNDIKSSFASLYGQRRRSPHPK